MKVVRTSDVDAQEVEGNYFRGRVSIQGIIGESEVFSIPTPPTMSCMLLREQE